MRREMIDAFKEGVAGGLRAAANDVEVLAEGLDNAEGRLAFGAVCAGWAAINRIKGKGGPMAQAIGANFVLGAIAPELYRGLARGARQLAARLDGGPLHRRVTVRAWDEESAPH